MTRRFASWAAMVSCCLVGACGSSNVKPPVKAAKPAEDPAAVAARLDRSRAWEAEGLTKHALTLSEKWGRVEVEGASPPKVDCANEDGGCLLTVPFGTNSNGIVRDTVCRLFFTENPPPFGAIVKEILKDWTLTSMPVLEVRWSETGAGLVARFRAPTQHRENGGVVVGHLKVAVMMMPQASVACLDLGLGALQTFNRVTDGFFDSLALRRGSDDGVLYERATRAREGELLRGFGYDFIRKGDEGGVREIHQEFRMDASDKSWGTWSRLSEIERRADGSIEAYRKRAWDGAQLRWTLTAKTGEGGALRLKAMVGDRSESLEVKPEAPLSTELWEAPALKRVASGALAKARYAFLTLNRDQEPALAYSTLTKVQPGVLSEDVQWPSKKPTDAPDRNELTVDNAGIVTKQVSSSVVYETMFSRGSLPRVAGKARPSDK